MMKAYGEGRNLTPAIQKPLNRSSPKLVQVIKLGMPTNVQNFIQIGSGVSFLRMRDFAPLWAKLHGYLGGGLIDNGYRRDTRTDFDAKDAVSRKEGPFGGRKTSI